MGKARIKAEDAGAVIAVAIDMASRASQLEAALVALIDAIDAKDAKAIRDALLVGRGLTF